MAGSFDLNSTLEFIFNHQNSEDGSGSFFSLKNSGKGKSRVLLFPRRLNHDFNSYPEYQMAKIRHMHTRFRT